MIGRRSARAPAATAIIVLSVLAVVAAGQAAVPVDETDAAWADGEVATGGFQAITVSAPTIVSCTASGNAVAPRMTVRWAFPPASGFTAPANIEMTFSNSGLVPNLLPIGNAVTTIGPDAGGVYTSSYDLGLLGGLIGTQGLLALESTIGGWNSPRVYRTARWPLLLGPATCEPA
jgi:hypothetical protein